MNMHMLEQPAQPKDLPYSSSINRYASNRFPLQRMPPLFLRNHFPFQALPFLDVIYEPPP